MKLCPLMLSCGQLFVVPWTVAHQAPLSMGFSSQKYLSGVAISYFRKSSRTRDSNCPSCVLHWQVDCLTRMIRKIWGTGLPWHTFYMQSHLYKY